MEAVGALQVPLIAHRRGDPDRAEAVVVQAGLDGIDRHPCAELVHRGGVQARREAQRRRVPQGLGVGAPAAVEDRVGHCGDPLGVELQRVLGAIHWVPLWAPYPHLPAVVLRRVVRRGVLHLDAEAPQRAAGHRAADPEDGAGVVRRRGRREVPGLELPVGAFACPVAPERTGERVGAREVLAPGQRVPVRVVGRVEIADGARGAEVEAGRRVEDDVAVEGHTVGDPEEDHHGARHATLQHHGLQALVRQGRQHREVPGPAGVQGLVRQRDELLRGPQPRAVGAGVIYQPHVRGVVLEERLLRVVQRQQNVEHLARPDACVRVEGERADPARRGPGSAREGIAEVVHEAVPIGVGLEQHLRPVWVCHAVADDGAGVALRELQQQLGRRRRQLRGARGDRRRGGDRRRLGLGGRRRGGGGVGAVVGAVVGVVVADGARGRRGDGDWLLRGLRRRRRSRGDAVLRGVGQRQPHQHAHDHLVALVAHEGHVPAARPALHEQLGGHRANWWYPVRPFRHEHHGGTRVVLVRVLGHERLRPVAEFGESQVGNLQAVSFVALGLARDRRHAQGILQP
mmetsp:Transcript_92447/g.261435  ORF Transcript_92447/g.261435 Transcript_92447/m.261435 type:complete len:571 (-) Transcript_92447:3101-4813(-)